ncbi:MAG: hypothetical protein H6631_00815 [Anaerolineaceae bacterium]|nr:hypothetical protein [Anaerolineaceae bacterium]MCB9098155.1 hypothetical protein [Anaerolineales bacterium]
MHSVARTLLSTLIGAGICASLGFLIFLLLTTFDNTPLVEGIAFSLVVAILCAFIGLIIGLIISLGNLGMIGGAIVGFMLTVVIGVFYVFSNSSPASYGYFLSESRIIFVVLTLPTILTGIATAGLKRLLPNP